MSIQQKLNITLLVCTLIGAAAPSAQAAEWRHGHRGGGDWDRGHWIHDRHDGRLGWWWVVGPAWYWYERPHSFVVVQQPAPPVVVQQAPAPVQTVVVAPPPAPASPVLYYCRATGTHYPETMTCPGGWMTMTAETPPQP